MKKLTIQAMRRLAKARGGRCLSDIYVSDCSKLLWQCAKGHQWTAPPARIKFGGWSPHCFGKAKSTIQQMRRLAKSRCGRCLSKVYVGSNTKLTWQCAKGHRWMAVPTSIQQGHWCPHCFHDSRRRPGLLKVKGRQL